MKMKKAAAAALAMVFLAGAVLTGCGGGAKNSASDTKQEGKKYTFRLAETHPPEHPTAQADEKFAELVAERSNGRIKIDFFPSAQLGEEKAVIEQVQLGAIEFTRVSTGPLAEFNKQLGAYSLPYIFDNNDHMWSFLNGPGGEKMLAGLESSKFKGLAYYTSGSRFFYSRKPLASIDDLKGQKIRVIQNKINMDMMAALGASATPMAWGEVFSALQTGVIDAAENNWPSYITANHFQSAKNVILDAHQRVPEVLMMSKVTWDKLSDDDKKLIQQAAKDSVTFQRDLWAKTETEAEAKARAAGVVITEVKDLKPWQDAVKPVIEKYRADYAETLTAIDAARK
jgi:tripartite ATP-independent transporter DctP family solute receptor